MTRHLLTPISPEISQVVVGWDRPLQSYFAQVFSTTADGEDDLLVWIGVLDRITDPKIVLDAVQPYTAIPDSLGDALLGDDNRADQNTPIAW